MASELANHRANLSAELMFDYVRVYLRKRSTNVSYDPAGYPTTLIIIISYRIGWPKRANSAYSGGCQDLMGIEKMVTRSRFFFFFFFQNCRI